MKSILTCSARAAIFFFMILACGGCAKEELAPALGEGAPVTVKLKFGTQEPGDIKVTTKAAQLNDYSEIISLYLFIYNADGTKCEKTVALSGNEIIDDGQDNSGHRYYTIDLETTVGQKKICGVANYATVRNWKDFSSRIEELGAEAMGGMSSTDLGKSLFYLVDDYVNNGSTIEFATAQMIFTGASDITVSNEGSTDGVLEMQRIVAHVEFNISNGKNGNNTVSFTPTTYRIYNLPKGTRLAGGRQIENNPAEASPDFYYDGSSEPIGSQAGGKWTFYFFMPENVQHTAGEVETYHQREEWNYEDNVGAAPEEKTYTYAPENATFVVISGEYSEYSPDGALVKSGTCNYTVHLGNFDMDNGGDWGDYSVRRNYSYTYNITVNGAESIIAEARTDGPGKQQGAEGDIVQIEEITRSFSLDAHYEQVLLDYNLSRIATTVQRSGVANGDNDGDGIDDVDEVIGQHIMLYIDTPFQSGGIRLEPYTIYCAAVGTAEGAAADQAAETAKEAALKDADYKWVEFYPQNNSTKLSSYPGLPLWKNDVNDINTSSNNNERILDVYDACVKLGKAVRKLVDGETLSTADFAEDGITVTSVWSGGTTEYYAYFTGFVDEYYYVNNPLTGKKLSSWNEFVNVDARTMMISMDVDTSDDGNSSSSSAHTSITQRSIKTFYDNTHATELTAFGVETFNETPLMSLGSYSESAKDQSNGRGNLLTQLDYRDFYRQWSNIINDSYNGYLESTGNTQRTLDYAYNDNSALRACMSRNRDLNGNGRIDNDEVRWYLPALSEYLRIGIGAPVLPGEAQLYTGDKTEMTFSGYPNNYVGLGALYYTSTIGSQVYWAVEKGAYGSDNSYASGCYPIRCVRILPNDLETLDKTSSSTFQLKTLTTATGSLWPSSYTNYVIDCRNTMVSSLYRTTPADNPLLPHNEDDSENRVYKGFVVSRNSTSISAGLNNLYDVQNRDGDRYDPCSDYTEQGEPDGSAWRVPNLTELTLMALSGMSIKSSTIACTQFSNLAVRQGFWYNNDLQIACNVTGKNNDSFGGGFVRCVRDATDAELDSAQ